MLLHLNGHHMHTYPALPPTNSLPLSLSLSLTLSAISLTLWLCGSGSDSRSNYNHHHSHLLSSALNNVHPAIVHTHEACAERRTTSMYVRRFNSSTGSLNDDVNHRMWSCAPSAFSVPPQQRSGIRRQETPVPTLKRRGQCDIFKKSIFLFYFKW